MRKALVAVAVAGLLGASSADAGRTKQLTATETAQEWVVREDPGTVIEVEVTRRGRALRARLGPNAATFHDSRVSVRVRSGQDGRFVFRYVAFGRAVPFRASYRIAN